MECFKNIWGSVDGQDVELYELVNDRGMRVRVMTYGATLIGVYVPDKEGKVQNVTLHLDTLEDYAAGHPFFGSVPGRYANRIRAGRFKLDGVEYHLAVNNGPNHLHGGIRGFDKYVWSAKTWYDSDSAAVEMSMRSPDGDEGYPGTLDVKVIYELTNKNELFMRYFAQTDKATVVNLTNHAYWNLHGCENPENELRPVENIMDHELQLCADNYLPTDADALVTGEILPVVGTIMDFTSPRKIGSMLEGITDGSAPEGAGYDHCYVVRKKDAEEEGFPGLSCAARVYEEKSGRVMTVYTTYPGVQLYTANYVSGLKGSHYIWNRWSGFCLETQNFPDSPNQVEFPCTVLRPGEVYQHTSVFCFGVNKSF
ncbi:MAG: aldose epimerase family protein [Planctomycetia bacterium]|nr:aldose epimerase family protein [Planctomycetia bacterium]